MNVESVAETTIGRIFIKLMAAIMESRFRYRFFNPTCILQGIEKMRGKKVLEIGCGTGFFTTQAAQMIGDDGSLLAMDMLQESVNAVSQKVKEAKITNVRVLKGDAMDTKLDTSSIDVAYIFGVIPAPMISTSRLLIEMHRVLKPEGILAIWPTSWTRKEILRTGLFSFQFKCNGVYNYHRK